MTLSSTLINFISLVIGGLTASSPLILTNIIDNYFQTYPTLLFVNNPYNDPNANLTISNDGKKAIYDLFMEITAPSNIIKLSYHSPSNFDLINTKTGDLLNKNAIRDGSIKYNSSEIQLKIPRLMPGGGDYINLDIEMEKGYLSSQYSYAYVYNNGSFKGFVESNPLLRTLNDYGLFLKIALIAIFLLILLYIFFYIPAIKKGYQKEFFKNIRKDIIDTIIHFKKEINSTKSLEFREKSQWFKLADNLDAINEKDKNPFFKYIFWNTYYDKRFAFDNNDYLLIDEFYRQADKRNENSNEPYDNNIKKLKKEIKELKKKIKTLERQMHNAALENNQESLEKEENNLSQKPDLTLNNKMLLDKAEEALKNIDWNKYISINKVG